MTETLEELLQAFNGEMQQTGERYAPYADRADASGYSMVAKFIRAVVASEKIRSRLYSIGIAEHASDAVDLFVCPRCGLVFMPEAPERCPVDETAAADFEKIA
jgi:rubrerythrin